MLIFCFLEIKLIKRTAIKRERARKQLQARNLSGSKHRVKHASRVGPSNGSGESAGNTRVYKDRQPPPRCIPFEVALEDSSPNRLKQPSETATPGSARSIPRSFSCFENGESSRSTHRSVDWFLCFFGLWWFSLSFSLVRCRMCGNEVNCFVGVSLVLISELWEILGSFLIRVCESAVPSFALPLVCNRVSWFS